MNQYLSLQGSNVEDIDGGNMRTREEGSITVEATLCVTLFMIFALFLTTLFYTVYVQEAVSHSIIQTADSLSLEAYSIKKLEPDVNTGAKAAITSLSAKLFSPGQEDEHFRTEQRWFSEDRLEEKYVEEPEMSTKNPEIRNIDLSEIIKDRFIGYLANGDEEYADQFLKKMGVIDGLSGVNFSESKVKSGKLYITARYQVKYLVNIGDLGKLNVCQEYCSKIWL